MVDLLVLTSLHKLLSIMKILFTFFTEQATLMRRQNVPSLPPQLEFPGSDKETVFKLTVSPLQQNSWGLHYITFYGSN